MPRWRASPPAGRRHRFREAIEAMRIKAPDAGQPPARGAARGRERRPAAEGVVARGAGEREPARHVGPLLDPHPDRGEHRAAAVPAAEPARRRARHGARPRHAAAGRRGRDRGRLPAARHRHGDPPHRPRGLQPVPGGRQARRPARALLRRAGALADRRRGDARDHRPPPPGRAAHDRGRDRARRRRARHGRGPLADPVRVRPARTSTRCPPPRSRACGSSRARRRRCGSRST